VQDFKKLDVWRKAHQLTVSVYQITQNLPKTEIYGLTSQIRRACVSIPSNIAEGCGRKGANEVSRFLQIGFGSACELEYQLLLAFDLKFISETDYQQLNNQAGEIKRMLTALIKKVEG
jgi:four helix bundle protein